MANPTPTRQGPGWLVVIIRDEIPMVLFDDPPSHRTVAIQLTEEQRAALALRYTGSSRGVDLYEEVTAAYLQNDTPWIVRERAKGRSDV